LCLSKHSILVDASQKGLKVNGYRFMIPATNKKISVRLGLKKSVARRIDEIAYRAGMMRHQLVERAIEYVIAHKVNIAEIAQNSTIKAFLSAPKEDLDAETSVRLYPEIHVQMEKICKLSGLTIRDFANYATAYYIIHVLKAINSESQLKHNVLQ